MFARPPGATIRNALAIVALTVPSIAAAERPPELAVYLGARTGANLDATSSVGPEAEADAGLSWGVSVGWWVRPDAWFEVLFDRQTLEFAPTPGSSIERFEMNSDFLQFGGAYEPPREGLRPYVTVALGLSRYGADPGSVSDSTGLSASIAGGFKVPMGRKALFRLEARGWAAFTSSSAAVSCGPGCSFAFSGEGWWQLGLRAGFAFRPGRAALEGGGSSGRNGSGAPRRG